MVVINQNAQSDQDWREEDEMAELYQSDWCKKHLTWYSLRCPFCEDEDSPTESLTESIEK